MGQQGNFEIGRFQNSPGDHRASARRKHPPGPGAGPGLLDSATAPGIGSLLPSLTTIPSIEAEAACCGKECRGVATQSANTAITSLLIGNLQRQWPCSDAVKAGTEEKDASKKKKVPRKRGLLGLIFQRDASQRYVLM